MDLSAFGLSSAQSALLVHHWALIKEANARTNLTAIRSDQSAETLHYRDSLFALRLGLLSAGPLVDFGSGAGFPGLVLAVARPEWPVLLVEPRRQRVVFLRQAVAALGLQNVEIWQGKLESPPPASQHHFAHALTRATFSDPARLAAAGRWLRPGGTLVAWRTATAPAAKIEAERHFYALQDGDEAPRQRCLTVLRF